MPAVIAEGIGWTPTLANRSCAAVLIPMPLSLTLDPPNSQAR
jgi:hypothetical protein